MNLETHFLCLELSPALRCKSLLLSSLVVQLLKSLPTVQESQVQSLGREDLLEKKMATHSSFLVWRIPWTEEPGGIQSVGL